MRVLYFHQHFSTPKGSVGIRSYEFSKRLLKRGHEVTVVCGTYLGGTTGLHGPFKNGMRVGHVEGIKVIEFQLNYSNSVNPLNRVILGMKYAFKSSKLIFSESYDLVFATSTPLTAGIPGIVARWIKNKPFIFEVRDLWPELPKALGAIKNPLILFLMSALERVSYHSANHLIALSPGILKGIESKGIDLKKITLIPNGCDLDIFSADAHQLRPEEIKDSDLLLLYAGTHGAANGLDELLEAALELQNRGHEDIKFLLIGQGGEKNNLIRHSQENNLRNVIFHNPISKEELSNLMSASDIGLQILANVPAFYYGTSPNKFFDYIAAGLPVLNNYPGWLAEMIEEHDCGYLVNPDNPMHFADTIEIIKKDILDLERKGKNSRLLAVKKFDRNNLSNAWVDVLENIFLK